MSPPALWRPDEHEALTEGTWDPLRVRAAIDLIRANRAHPTWGLMWGSPGTILAGKACGLQDAWRDSAEVLAERWDPASDMWPHELYGR